MLRTIPTFKITVRSSDEIATVNHLKMSGFRPTKINRQTDGTVSLLYSPPPDRITAFNQSLPDYLNPKMDIVRSLIDWN